MENKEYPTYVFEESDLSIMRKALKDFFPNKEEFIKFVHSIQANPSPYVYRNKDFQSI